MTEESREHFILEFSADETEASLTLALPREAPLPDEGYIVDYVRERGIDASCDRAAIQKMLAERNLNQSVVIARGKKPRPAIDGRVEYLFGKEEKSRDQDNEPVDHRELRTVRAVAKGEVIARLLPPVQGEDGLTVTGKVIPAGEPRPAVLPRGENAVIDKNNPSLLIASEHGAVRIISETQVDVEPLLSFPGNIDYSVGNIDFTGSVIIRGDVLPGFRVQCTGAVEVQGIIDDAEVIAGGDVSAYGCAGREKGLVRAGRDVKMRYAKNIEIQAGRDIVVEDYLINCNAQADNMISVVARKGLIVGGKVIASHLVEANTAGNVEGTRTIISAGFSMELRQQLSLLDTEQTGNLKDLGKINRALKTLSRIVMIQKEVSSAIKKQITVLMKMKEEVEDKIQYLLEKQEETMMKIGKVKKAAIRINGVILPGVVIKFPNNQIVVREKYVKSMYKYKDDRVSLVSAG